MDAVPPTPPPPSPPAHVYAATEYRPKGPHELELCEKASSVDWLYLGAGLALDVATVALDNQVFQTQSTTGARLLGPSFIGLSWGFTIGGGYLALPKCSPDWVEAAPPDDMGGDPTASWPAAVALTVLAMATAPVLVGVETGQGTVTVPWSTTERSMRLVLAGAGGVIGALVPYLLPPKTWRAKKELEHLRAGVTANGAFVGYQATF